MAEQSENGSVDSANVDGRRRRFLTATTSVIGAAGVVGLAVPFLTSMSPSARARAAGAPVEVDISKLEVGQKITVEWRGKPVWIVRRTEQSLSELSSLDEQLADPASEIITQPTYVTGIARSVKPEYMVMVGICTHLGCSPTYRPDIAAPDLGKDWKGGFYCPCHGSKFDLAGRVYKSVPAPKNLEVPPHFYASETNIVIGTDPSVAGGAA